ncbi:DUF2470 domain-containing protein [Salinibacter grassmerensis]|uniref:DUF2470 domain-containing protein n=1 Tax=Salinibacter grassmerensis TaxID=3040353 RepID=UPI0021E88214|nr:DUF2470 domain-containing protein [Salinibacter grassmerensis]
MADHVFSPEDVSRIVGHMNDAHSEDLVRYAEAYGDVTEVEGVRMTGIDVEGFDLEVEQKSATVPVRIDFDAPLDTVDEARAALVEMAMAAQDAAER